MVFYSMSSSTVRTGFNWIFAVSPSFAGHTPFQGQTPETIYSQILVDDIVRAPQAFDRLFSTTTRLLYSQLVLELILKSDLFILFFLHRHLDQTYPKKLGISFCSFAPKILASDYAAVRAMVSSSFATMHFSKILTGPIYSAVGCRVLLGGL